ncbi:AAA family ATPase [Pseudoduganella sp. FT93W]|uniref:AAA family ATPase n=1 Tax=Duganella fentianensis TaxID=2692177 RepID=A0A845I2P5_9BURK|nr:AAA family ATPase [Duganella fentianensis]MYN47563.1 AAA family ATPase [Duganella fentianensis]
MQTLSPNCVTANYTPQRIPQFIGNKLIEALPPSMSDDELFLALSLNPPFAPEQRTWATHERMYMLKELKNFMVPLAKHIELARALDSMIRSGYVGRAPRTPEHTAIFKTIHEHEKAKRTFAQAANTHTPQISTSLIGISGMGKTTLVKRWCAHIDQVIYHPDLHVYQVPYLHIEMPSDGSSVKGLAHGILQKLDQLIPGANYYEEYAVKGRPGADTLMRSVARLLNRHFVGILICDEVQNLANSRKGQQTVMTELVSACNDLRVPILFIGTTKALKVLSLDFRQARRSCGHGVAPWQRLSFEVHPGEVNEWQVFVEILWQNQWVRNPVELTDDLLTAMYRYSQGIIDVAITLFASAQARAMLDESETITPELIRKVFVDELGPLHGAIDALYHDDVEAISLFDDIGSQIELNGIIDSMSRKAQSKASPLYQVTSNDATYAERISSGLVAMGFGEEESLAAAQSTIKPNQRLSLIEGSKKAIEALTVPKKTSRTKSKELNEEIATFDGRPADYRRALSAAKQTGESVLHHMRALGLVKPTHQLLELR